MSKIIVSRSFDFFRCFITRYTKYILIAIIILWWLPAIAREIKLTKNLEDKQAVSQNKLLASRKQTNARGGSPYPQFRYQGNNVRWINEQMPLRVYVSRGLCLDQVGTDPVYGGPLTNVDNTNNWPDLVAGVVNTLTNLPVASAYCEGMWQAARQGINQWKQFEPEGLFSYQFTDDPQDADIYFFWTDHFVNKLGLGLFASDIRGYTAKYLLPYHPVMQALKAGEIGKIQFKPVVVILRTTDARGNPMSLNKINAAAAHEMGHVLGIDGHSTNPGDLMSIYYGHGIISPNDAATIRYLYKQTPGYLP